MSITDPEILMCIYVVICFYMVLLHDSSLSSAVYVVIGSRVGQCSRDSSRQANGAGDQVPFNYIQRP